MTPAGPRFWAQARRWTPGLVISAVAIYAILRIVKWQDLQLSFAAIHWEYLLIATLIVTVSLILRAIAWKTLLDGKPTVKQAFFAICVGYLLNNLFPFRFGELGRSVLLGRSSRVGTFRVFSTVIIERALDVGVAALLLLTTLPLVLGTEWIKKAAWSALALVVLAFVLLFLMAWNKTWVENVLSKISLKWPGFKNIQARILQPLLDGLGALRHPSQFLIAAGLILAAWGLWVANYYVMLAPIVPETIFWWAAFINAVLALGVALPSAPAALGVYEAAMVAALVLLGVSESTALAYAILMHFFQFVYTGIMGFTGLLLEGQSLSTIFNEVSMREKQPSS